MPNRQAALGVSLFVLWSVTAPSSAQTLVWDGNQPVDGSFDGTFGVASNWNPNQSPASAIELVFDPAAIYEVTFDNVEKVGEFQVRDGIVSFVSDSSTVRTLTIATDGGDSDADIDVSGGTLNVGTAGSPVVVSGADAILFVGVATNGTLNVDGSSSQLDAEGISRTHPIGGTGGDGTLNLTDGAVANIGTGFTLDVGSSNSSATDGVLLVDTGSTLNTGNLDIADRTSGATGLVTVQGMNSVINQLLTDAYLTVGSSSGGGGTLTIGTEGTFNSGTGSIAVNATGTLNIQNGTFNANGPVTMAAGSTLTLDGGALNAAAGLDNSAGGTLDFRDGTLTINGGTFEPGAGDFVIEGETASDLPHLVFTGSGTASFAADVVVGQTGPAQLTIEGGADVPEFTRLWVGGNGGTAEGAGTVTVAGNSSLTTRTLLVGRTATGDLIVEGGGRVTALFSASVGSFEPGTATVSGDGSMLTVMFELDVGSADIGNLLIDNGGQVSSNGGCMGCAIDGSTGTRGEGHVTVSGDGSTWSNSGDLEVGNTDATLTIEMQGMVSNQSGFVAQFPTATGTVIVTGTGSTWINSANLFVGGSNMAAGGTGVLTLEDSGRVQVDGTLKIWNDGVVNVDGGTLDLNGSIEDGGGTFNFTSGVINTTDPANEIVFSASGISIGTVPLNLSPATFGPTDALNAAGNAYVEREAQLNLSGGALSSASLILQSGSAVAHSAGSSAVISRVVALGGSQINVTAGDLAMGEANAVNGFYSNGTVSVGGGATLTLADANDAAFDTAALATLGDGSPGTLAATNGLTLDFGGNITGFGTVDTPNDPAKPVINNGNITGNSLAEPIELTGYVKGVGTCDNCHITGTDSPGFSTAAVNRGSVSYNGTLEIEVGGTSPGSGYDQLNHILGAGDANLGGTLEVLMLGNFVPDVGQTFDILTATGELNGTFDTELLAAVPGGLFFDVLYGESVVTLSVEGLPGDYNYDGTVDVADATVWRDMLGQTGTGLAADGDSDGVVGPGDYNVWVTNFGMSIPGALIDSAGTPVPEPATCSLLCGWAVVAVMRCRMCVE